MPEIPVWVLIVCAIGVVLGLALWFFWPKTFNPEKVLRLLKCEGWVVEDGGRSAYNAKLRLRFRRNRSWDAVGIPRGHHLIEFWTTIFGGDWKPVYVYPIHEGYPSGDNPDRQIYDIAVQWFGPPSP